MTIKFINIYFYQSYTSFLLPILSFNIDSQKGRFKLISNGYYLQICVNLIKFDLIRSFTQRFFQSYCFSLFVGSWYNLLVNIICDDHQERGRVMMKFADLIEENLEEIAALDSLDAGKLFTIGKMIDIPGAAHWLRYYAGAADKIHGHTLKMSRALQGYTLREPIGVVGQIIPWNYPTTMFFLKVAPALAAGCTVVMKPAEQTPLSALFYAHLSKLVRLSLTCVSRMTFRYVFY